MHETATLPPPLVIPPEVEAFAAEKGAADYLPAVAALAQRLVPNHLVTVRIDDDPELSYNRTILFWVEVRGWDVEALVRVNNGWCDEIFACCPAPLVHVFGFTVWPVE